MRRPLWIWCLVALGCGREPPSSHPGADSSASFVGTESCTACHREEADLWRGSHHDRAMEEATADSVRGDFNGAAFTHDGVDSTFFRRDGGFFVRTDGPDGALTDYRVAYTFGVEPLQQYLIAFPSGRYQALSIAWDTEGERWFHLYPDESIDHEDPLHWTKRLQSWNLMCADCHSTNLDKRYDAASDSYDTSFSEIDVACEACHGPGSRHVAWAESEPRPHEGEGVQGLGLGLVVDLGAGDDGVWVMDLETGLSKRDPPRTSRTEVETCGRCHSRRSAPVADYEHGRPLLDTHRVALLDEPLYYQDGQIRDEVYVYGSFLQSKMYREGVTCQDCHDPHNLSTRAEGNGVCAACHLSEKFDSPTHHHHEPGTESALCVSCHMTATTYMVVDPRRDHSFRVPRPELSAASGSPNACNACHSDRAPAWSEARIGEWRGSEARPPAPAEPEAAIVRATSLSHRPFDARTEIALSDDDPLVRLAAVGAAETLPPAARRPRIVPRLDDDVRLVRHEAARVLASVPRSLFTPEQWSRLSEVLADYRAGLERNADWPESHLNAGILLTALGELERAEEAYRTAMRIDPDLPNAYVNLADLHRARGRDEEAVAVLREAIALAPEQAEVMHALGLALVRTSRTAEAVEWLGRAAEARPELARYAYVHGVALNGTGRAGRAIEVLEQAAERHPEDREILVALATMHRDQGHFPRAIVYARRLVELAPDDPAPRQLLNELERALAGAGARR